MLSRVMKAHNRRLIMAVRLRNCCCGCSLKEGTVVLGILFILTSAGVMLYCIYFVTWYIINYKDSSNAASAYPQVVLPAVLTILVCSLTELVTSSTLLRGVVKYNRRLVLPWLLYNGLLCGLLFLIVVGGGIACFIVTAARIQGDLTSAMLGFLILIPGAVAVGAYVYFLLVVYSFYSILPLLSSDRIAILLDRFKNPELQSDLDTNTEHWPSLPRNNTFVGY